MGKLICDICGGNIVMQSSGEVGICECCGVAYAVERMREIFNGEKSEFTNTNNGIENLRELVKKYYAVGAFADAENVVKKILELSPDDEQANKQYDELQILKYFDIRNGEIVSYSGKARKIVIPPIVEKVDMIVFRNNDALEELVIPEGVKEICSGPNTTYKYSLRNLKKISLPKSLKIIGINTFSNTKLNEIQIPDSVQEIQASSFEGCSMLKEIILPDSIKSIGDAAFKDCSSLEKIVIPELVYEIGSEAFKGCCSLKEVVFNKKLKNIGIFAFSHCYKLKQIDLPKGLEKIGVGLFDACANLEKLTIPDSVNNIVYVYQGSNRITALCRGCHKLKKVNYPEKFTPLLFKESSFYDTAEYDYRMMRYDKIRQGICPECGGTLSGWLTKRCNKCHKEY